MRSTTKFVSLLLALTMALGVMACSDDDVTPVKDAALADKPAVIPDQGKASPLDCKTGSCTDFVLDKILMATTSSTATEYALEFKGKKYNALGNIISLLVSQAPTMDIQSTIDSGVCAGGTVVLLRVQAKDMTSETSAKAQAWVGQDKVCCTADKSDKDYSTKCCAEAAKGCFNGKGEFAKKKSTEDMLFQGKITGGNLKLGPSKMKLNIPLVGTEVLELTLKYAHIKGVSTKDKITKGVLSGAIPKSELDKKVIPQVAKMVNDTYIDPKTDKSTKDMLKQLFDTNGDGKIEVKEVTENALIKTFLAGDVDVDGDGEKELSLGIGFTATGAVIKDSIITPDKGTTPTPDKGTTPTPDKGTTPTPDKGTTPVPDSGAGSQ